jgi:membrane-bound lytic murein transglycosylase B
MKMFYALALTALFFPFAASAQAAPNAQPFDQWLAQFKTDARAAGISQATLDQAFEGTEPDESIIVLDNKQPEGRLTLAQYLKNTLSKKRIADGRRFMDENAYLLAQVGNAYGVQPRFIAALWGIETDYGRNTGNFVTTDALATLAYDGRRADFFRGELLAALKILEAEGMKAEEMYGSWAGAVGQCQFMPSTYLKYAVDFDHDGKRDVWGDKADAFASIAHYLQGLGWNKDEGWGRPVEVPEGFDMTLADITKPKPLSQWAAMGVRKEDGSALPPGDMPASLIVIGEGDDAATYIVYGNFRALLQWNRSRYFATSVGMLADAIAP